MNQKRGKRKRDLDVETKRGSAYQSLVGEILQIFHPDAEMKIGEWIEGPDGERDMDVALWRPSEAGIQFLLVECKDYTYAKRPRRVGIKEVDAFDSKRKDLNAHFALIASNSGFTAPALRKAARVRIGAIAVLNQGDKRAKARFEMELILRQISFGAPQFTMTYHHDGASFVDTIPSKTLMIAGESVDHWLVSQAMCFQAAHPWVTEPLFMKFHFLNPVSAKSGTSETVLSAIEINFQFKTRWLRQRVSVDAKPGLVDFLRGKVVLAPGNFGITINDINFSKAQPSDPPSFDEYAWQASQRGDVLFQFCMFMGMGDFQPTPKSKISELVVAEDLADVWGDFSAPSP